MTDHPYRPSPPPPPPLEQASLWRRCLCWLGRHEYGWDSGKQDGRYLIRARAIQSWTRLDTRLKCIHCPVAIGPLSGRSALEPSTSFSWMSNPQYLAQVGHFLGGALLVFAVGVLWGLPLWAFGVGMAAAAFKEFVFDLASWGESDSLADSLMDFGFYVLGGLAGLGLHAWAVARHVLATTT